MTIKIGDIVNAYGSDDDENYAIAIVVSFSEDKKVANVLWIKNKVYKPLIGKVTFYDTDSFVKLD